MARPPADGGGASTHTAAQGGKIDYSDPLPSEEDLLYEEELLRTPHVTKLWTRYLEARKDATAKRRYLIYERAVKALPGSYKVPELLCALTQHRDLRTRHLVICKRSLPAPFFFYAFPPPGRAIERAFLRRDGTRGREGGAGILSRGALNTLKEKTRALTTTLHTPSPSLRTCKKNSCGTRISRRGTRRCEA